MPLTHLLFLKKWESQFIFKEKIDKAGKELIEEKITKEFFAKTADAQSKQKAAGGGVQESPLLTDSLNL